VTQLTTVQQKLKQHGLTDGAKLEPSICLCDHKLIGTGAIFLQSIGLIFCNNCKGWQSIRKPLK